MRNFYSPEVEKNALRKLLCILGKSRREIMFILIISMKVYFAYILVSGCFWYVKHIASGPLCMKQPKMTV